MKDQCIIAEFVDIPTAQLGLEVLAKAGFGEEHVSFVSRSDASELSKIAKLEKDSSDKSGGAGGALVGGLLGGALAIPVAVSTLLGPFFLAGPLVGAGIGAAVGGMLGGAQRWGVHKEARHTYEERVREGSVLVIVAGTRAELLEAEASLLTTGPTSLKWFASPETAES